MFDSMNTILEGTSGNYLDLLANQLDECNIEIQPLRSFKNISKLMSINAAISNDFLFLHFAE